jgi:Flp pilus assembly protein TadD
MLGDDNSDSWTIGGGNIKRTKGSAEKDPRGNVVILGYEEGAPQTDTMTDVATETEGESSVPSHLHCMKEACRFYKEKSGDCQFDLVFSMLEQRQENAPQVDSGEIAEAVGEEVAKDIDKIWKFQTKSVEELIKGFGESDKNQTKSIADLKKDLERAINKIAMRVEKSGTGSIRKDISNLRKRIDEREQGFEDLSGTMSELVLNLHESITKLEGKSEDALSRLKGLSDATPDASSMKNLIEDSIERRMKDLEPDDLFGSLEDIRKQLDDVLENQKDDPAWVDTLNGLHKQLETVLERQNGSGYHEKLDATLRAQHQLESRSEEWQDEISERIQDLSTRQRAWEDRLQKLLDQHDEVVEALEDLRKQRDTDHGRTGKRDAKKFNNLGVTSFHNGAYEMARDQFVQAVHLDPEFAEAYNNLGLAYTELNEEDKASDAFSRAIELNPALHAAYNNLGYIHFKKGDYDQAIEMYNEALGRSTHNSSAYTNLGNAYYKLGRNEDAKQAWTKALEIDPGNEKAKRNLDRIDKDAD